MLAAKIPLALYVHLPWCVRKCPYCDFNSHESPRQRPEEAYLQALRRDLDWQKDLASGRALVSIFFGGGTPSLLSPAFYQQLLQAIDSALGLGAGIEITMEANPGTMEHGDWRAYARAGINRVSLGVQSFDDQRLAALGRIHDAQAADQALHTLRAAGFERINIDLMHGLPGQDVPGALRDLQRALAHAPEQISWYQLTLEPNTVFYRQQPILPDEDTREAIDEQGGALLQAAGYQPYEVSAWTRERPAAHNLNYWTFGDYLALGAGAHGKISRPDGIYRYQQTRLPEDYMRAMQAGRYAELRMVPERERPFEFFMNALRLRQGVPRALFTERTGCPEHRAQACLEAAQTQGLIESEGDRWVCTPLGYRFLNRVLEQLT